MFGEMALITGKPRNASVIAIEQTSCAVLERADFERALMEHPGIALALPRVMAERLERANHSIGIDFVNLSRLKIDPRVLTPASTVPGKWGEKVVLRILDKSNTQLGLDKLITDAGTLTLVREMIAQPYGII